MRTEANVLPPCCPKRLTRSAVLCSLVVFATLTSAVSSKASALSRDANRVERAWVRASSAVTRMPPRFLAAGEAVPLVLPHTTERDEQGCVTVGVLGTRTLDFSLELGRSEGVLSKQPAPRRTSADHQSIAGSAMLVRCGQARSELRNLVIRMKSPQGAVEVLVARGRSPAPSIDSLLPERAAGTTLRTERPGLPPAVGPLPQRLDLAAQRIREAGGDVAARTSWQADRRGAVEQRLHLDPACHRLIAAPDLEVRGRALVSDTDMEIRNPATDDVLLRDRSFATDAMVELCVGEPEMIDVAIGGVPPGGEVTLLQGQWPLPQGIPRTWAPRTRAAVAHALLHRRGPALSEAPVWEGVGSGGSTVIPVGVEPGACYLVAAGAAAGDVKAVQVSAQVGPRLAADNGGAGMDAAAVTFCVRTEQVARVEIGAYGTRVTWIAGAWKVARTPIGAEVLP